MVLSVLVCSEAARTINSHLSATDLERLNKVFLDGIKSNDLQAIYFSSLNFKELTNDVKLSVCDRLIALHAESKLNEFEKNFYLTGAHRQIGCQAAVPSNIASTIKSSLTKDTSTAHELYFNYFSNKNIGATIDDATKGRIATNLQSILKTDDSLSR